MTFSKSSAAHRGAFCATPVFRASMAPPGTSKKNDATTVFVAGATGNVGRRLVKRLAEAGCRVRAGSRDPAKCRERVGDLGDLAESVDYVPFDLSRESEWKGAMGESSVVVSTLGSPLSWGKVDGFGIAKLMTTGAKLPNVEQLIVVSSIGVGRPWAFPAAMLNLFGAVLIFKDYSETILRQTAAKNGKKYLIVRPGGMESPKDDFFKTHNARIEKRNALATGLVSNMQIAELITAAVIHPDAADGKTVEVVAETDAPKVDYKTLLENAVKD